MHQQCGAHDLYDQPPVNARTWSVFPSVAAARTCSRLVFCAASSGGSATRWRLLSTLVVNHCARVLPDLTDLELNCCCHPSLSPKRIMTYSDYKEIQSSAEPGWLGRASRGDGWGERRATGPRARNACFRDRARGRATLGPRAAFTKRSRIYVTFLVMDPHTKRLSDQ